MKDRCQSLSMECGMDDHDRTTLQMKLKDLRVLVFKQRQMGYFFGGLYSGDCEPDFWSIASGVCFWYLNSYVGI